MKAKARVFGRFTYASKSEEATVIIDRDLRLFSVRPLRRRRVYTLPLADVAEMTVRHIICAEVAEKRKLKRRKRLTVKRFS